MVNLQDDEQISDLGEMNNDDGPDNSIILTEGTLQLKRKDIKEVHTRCTIWLKPEFGDVSQERPCNPHPGIQMINSQLRVMDDVDWPWQVIDLHNKNFKFFIEQSDVTWRQRLVLMKKLALAIKHLHDSGDFHGNLSEECITINSDGRDRPFIWNVSTAQQQTEETTATNQDSDIKNLGVIFYSLLTKGASCNDGIEPKKIIEYLLENAEDLLQPPIHDLHRVSTEHTNTLKKVLSQEPAETAKDLIDKMIGRKINIEGVLQHPLFWSDNEKANFVADLFNSMGRNSKMFDKLEQESKHLVFASDWVEKLRLSSAEKTTILDIRNNDICNESKAGQQRGNVKKDLFVNRATGSQKNQPIKISHFIIIDGHLKLVIEDPKADNKTWKKLKKLKLGENKDGYAEMPDAIKKKDSWVDYKNDECIIAMPLVFKKEIEKPGGYNRTSLYHLVRFIRNRRAHCCDKGEGSETERQYYQDLGGFWNFYSGRFPKLLTVLHNARKEFPIYDDSIPFAK